MNRKIIRDGKVLTVVLLLFCLMSGLFITTVLAAGTCQTTLTMRQIFTGSSKVPSETFTYELTPALVSNPMPAGSSAKCYTFTITGTSDMDIGPIIFTQMGTYKYEINHITSPQSDYTYDQKVYTIEIWVDNSLNAAVLAYNKDGVKVSDITYEHMHNLLSNKSSNPSYPGNPNYPDSSDKSVKSGKPGPITGDEARTVLYIALICAAGAAALGSVIYLLVGRRYGKDCDEHEA